MNMFMFRLANRGATARWGEALGRKLRAGDFIALVGDLGTGKTTLTQSLARGLEVREAVTSPTFTLVQEYEGRVPLFHFDPYRLDVPEDLLGIGWDEYGERGGVLVMEWADKMTAILPPERLNLQLEIEERNGTETNDESENEANECAEDAANDLEDMPRRLMVVPQGERYTALLAELMAEPELRAMLVENKMSGAE